MVSARAAEAGVIAFEGVGFSYGARPVLADASFDLEPGSLHFLTGRSGAGKTTLMRLIHLSLLPTAGRVMLFGRDTRAVGRRERALLRRRLGLILQERDLLDHMTVRENIALPLRVAGEDVAARAPDIAALAAWVGLTELLDARPPQLSSGEQRRAAVARALIAAPDLVLADEPTGDVDSEGAERILRLFLELHEAGRTVLIATHDLTLIRKAQGRSQARTLRLERGRAIRAGAPL